MKKTEGQKNNQIKHCDRLLRLTQVLDIIPVSKSGWWAGVKEGRFPQPIKLGPRTTAWRESEIVAIMQKSWDET